MPSGRRALLDRWGGHRGTINKRIRFNDREWITVPEIKAVPEGIRPEMLMYQDNPIIEIPIEHLVEGVNVFEGDCDEAGGFGWGQWGLYSLVLRVFYDREAKGDGFAIDGQITSPRRGDVVNEDPPISISATAPSGVARIDVLASYDGYDENGDGRFDGYHESHFQQVRGEPVQLADHVGTLRRRPYRMNWDTHWVPDQTPGSISLLARIQDARGYWSVTQPVDDLTLRRDDTSVRLYRATGVPEDFSVRVDETKECFFEIPESDAVKHATEAALHLRTWHGFDGHHDPIRINDHSMPIDGKNHHYDYDLLSFPAEALRQGKNTFTMHSTTEHHMLEVLWPGPALVVRYAMPDVSIREDVSIRPDVSIVEDRYEDRDHYVIETPNATFWLDRQSGGLSRLIDRDGQDWIAFHREPWDQYPPSAASAFRGIPNLVFGREESGFGHPGWDRATSQKVSDRSIVCTSRSGRWQLRWDFSADGARLTVEKTDDDAAYWFLYEGPIAGRWAPRQQYFATDVDSPIDQPHDYFKGDRLYGRWRWAYFGDRSTARVLYLVHEQDDTALDTFSHLGNTKDGLDSPDGMVVFGFGRGKEGDRTAFAGEELVPHRLVGAGGWRHDGVPSADRAYRNPFG